MKEVTMSKKSVVEWMLNQLEGYEYNRIKRKNSWADSVKHLEYIKKKAQQMHKEEIVDAFVECWKENMPEGYECKQSAEYYYQETYEQTVTNCNDLSSPKTSDN